jgi:hypothetical protein
MKYILIVLVLLSSNVQALTESPRAPGVNFCTAMGYMQQGSTLMRDTGTPHKIALRDMMIGQIKASVESQIIFRLKLTKRIIDFTYLNPQLSAEELQRRAVKVCQRATKHIK